MAGVLADVRRRLPGVSNRHDTGMYTVRRQRCVLCPSPEEKSHTLVFERSAVRALCTGGLLRRRQ